MKIIAGNSNKILAEAICSYIGVSLANTSLRKFADREIFVEINENIRGEDVFIISWLGNDYNKVTTNKYWTLKGLCRCSWKM